MPGAMKLRTFCGDEPVFLFLTNQATTLLKSTDACVVRNIDAGLPEDKAGGLTARWLILYAAHRAFD